MESAHRNRSPARAQELARTRAPAFVRADPRKASNFGQMAMLVADVTLTDDDKNTNTLSHTNTHTHTKHEFASGACVRAHTDRVTKAVKQRVICMKNKLRWCWLSSSEPFSHMNEEMFFWNGFFSLSFSAFSASARIRPHVFGADCDF